jgi:hypothetical protein
MSRKVTRSVNAVPIGRHVNGVATLALVPGGVFDTNAHGPVHTSPLSSTTEMDGISQSRTSWRIARDRYADLKDRDRRPMRQMAIFGTLDAIKVTHSDGAVT